MAVTALMITLRRVDRLTLSFSSRPVRMGAYYINHDSRWLLCLVRYLLGSREGKSEDRSFVQG